MTLEGWDFDKPKQTEKEVKFTKFPAGITNIRLLDKAPFVRWTHWFQREMRSINCPGIGCPICEIRQNEKQNKMPQTYPIARRFAINVYNHETKQVEIMEQGKTVFEDIRDVLMDLKEEGKTPMEADLRVRRRGTGKDDTNYRVDLGGALPLPKNVEESVTVLEDFFKPHQPEQILRLLNGETWEEVMYAKESESTKEKTETDEEFSVE